MFRPQYTITPVLLERIKRITLLVHELNRRHVSEAALMQMQEEARAVSTFASTSIEGNPLPLTKVKRLLKNRPQQARDSEREVFNYSELLAFVQENQPLLDPLLLARLFHKQMVIIHPFKPMRYGMGARAKRLDGNWSVIL